jgi:hypothetical protein
LWIAVVRNSPNLLPLCIGGSSYEQNRTSLVRSEEAFVPREQAHQELVLAGHIGEVVDATEANIRYVA